MDNFWNKNPPSHKASAVQSKIFSAITSMLCDKINKRNEAILSEKSENRRAISSAIRRGDFMIL